MSLVPKTLLRVDLDRAIAVDSALLERQERVVPHVARVQVGLHQPGLCVRVDDEVVAEVLSIDNLALILARMFSVAEVLGTESALHP
jgi:hypothetical protein